MRKLEKLMFHNSFDELNNMVRWNGFNRINDETVGHHSFIVSWITRIICENIFVDSKPILDCTTYAIFHDFNEFITGDVNHNVKYNQFNGESIRNSLDEFISWYVDKNFPKSLDKTSILLNKMLKEEIDPFVKKIVKVADWMSMLMYLHKEYSLGNKNAELRIDYCKEKLENAVIDAVESLQNNCKYKVDCSILID